MIKNKTITLGYRYDQQRKKRVFWYAAVFIVSINCIRYVRKYTDNSLVDNSRVCARLKNGTTDSSETNRIWYSWITDQSFYWLEGDQSPCIVRQTVIDSGKSDENSMNMNMKTLSDKISPDHKWIITNKSDPNPQSNTHHFILSDRFENQFTEFSHGEPESSCWSPDSRSIFTLDANSDVYQYDLHGKIVHPPMHIPSSFGDAQTLPMLAGICKDGDVYIVYCNTSFTETGTVVYGAKVNLENHTISQPRELFRVPEGTSLDDVVLSPTRDRLAWQFSITSFFAFRLLESHRAEIWVSAIDGSEMHSLGSVALAPVEIGLYQDMDTLLNIRWLPSGKKLSFVCLDYDVENVYLYDLKER